MSDPTMDRPELITLTEQQQGWVFERLGERRSACGACGGTEFEVGKALYLGFLFRSEEQDAYMIALTCTNRECPAPRTGLRLRGSELLLSQEA